MDSSGTELFYLMHRFSFHYMNQSYSTKDIFLLTYIFIYSVVWYITIQVSSGLHLLGLKPFELHLQLCYCQRLLTLSNNLFQQWLRHPTMCRRKYSCQSLVKSHLQSVAFEKSFVSLFLLLLHNKDLLHSTSAPAQSCFAIESSGVKQKASGFTKRCGLM